MVSQISSTNITPVVYNQQQRKKTGNYNKELALVGSAVGVTTGYFLSRKVDLKKNHHILDELIKLLSMAGGSIVGGVLASSVTASKESVKRKWHEAGFQMMNTTIPMLLVAFSNLLCDKYAKKNDFLRIIASGIAMTSGAVVATKITNNTNPAEHVKRKYSPKDALANIDDIVATIAIGFPKLNYLHLDTRLMPFIYAYNGYRSGKKE